MYHAVLTCAWWQFFAFVVVAFLSVNTVFAIVYTFDEGGIANARPGSFEDAFYFSVQTLATIGYGSMAPVTRLAHLVVTCEAIVGMLGVALVTGITFAKFARPTARVLFTEKLVIAHRDGIPHLMMRMANARQNMILEAQLRVVVLMEQRSREGHVLRRPVELPLVTDRTAMFVLSWTAMHRIDESSPFYGDDAIARLREKKAEIFLSLNGTDETFAQTVHARKFYTLDDVVRDKIYADMLSVAADGTRELDYGNFDVLIDSPPPPRAESPVPTAIAG